MIINCPTCGNIGDWCQSCDGIGRIVEAPVFVDELPMLQIPKEFTERYAKYVDAGKVLDKLSDPDIQPKPGTKAPGPTPTRRKQ